VAAPVRASYPLGPGVEVTNVRDLLDVFLPMG
jgi:hypothetical protein